MKSPWKCSKCDYVSGRRWNTKSHIFNKHAGAGSPVPLTRSKQSRVPTNYSNQIFTIHKTEREKLTLGLVDSNLHPNEFYQELSPLASLDNREKKLHSFIDEITPQFEEVEKLFGTSEFDFKNKLGLIIYSSVYSDNPINSMSEYLKIYRTLTIRRRIVDCVASFLNADCITAKEILKNAFMS